MEAFLLCHPNFQEAAQKYLAKLERKETRKALKEQRKQLAGREAEMDAELAAEASVIHRELQEDI